MTHPLALCHYTMIDVAPPELVTLASRCGFGAVSLMLHGPAGIPSYPMHGDNAMRRETKRRMDDTGVVLCDASTCRLGPDSDVEDFRPLMEVAAELGARQFNVNGVDPDRGRLIERFAALCALGVEHGLRAGIEFMMISDVKSLGDALEVIAGSHATNAVVTVDAVHLARSGGSPAEVAALDPELIGYVQLCDGPSAMPADQFLWEAGTERRLPGDGELPLTALVSAIPDGMVVGAEIPSQSRREAGVSAEEFAASIHAALTRTVTAAGRG